MSDSDSYVTPWWPEGHDASDWRYAFQSASWFRAGTPGEFLREQPYREPDVAAVELHHVSYHGALFNPAKDMAGTELQLYALIRFADGTYGALDAGNDYTGWGCSGDSSDMRIGDRETVIRSGMSQGMRTALGLTLDEVA